MVMIAATSSTIRDIAYIVLVSVRGYAVVVLLNFFVAGGLLYLRFLSDERHDWTRTSGFKPWGGSTAAIISTLVCAFLLSAAFIPPSSDSPFAKANTGLAWYIVPTAGLASVVLGVVCYIGFKYVYPPLLKDGKVLIVDREALIVREHGEYVQALEHVEANWERRSGPASNEGFDNKQLAPLPDEYFSIRVDEEPPLRPLDITEQRPLEEKILELSLPHSYGSRQSSLTVFRKSESEFRLVKTTKLTDNPLYHSEEGSNVHMNSTRLVPAYAIPGGSSNTHNIALCNDRGQHEEWLSLKTLEDVTALQRALTGYRIHLSMSNFSWCINGSREPEDSGNGSLQLWQLKPLPAMHSQTGAGTLDHSESNITTASTVLGDAATAASGTSTNARSRSRFSTSTANSTSNTTTMSGSSITATVNGPRGDGIELVRPEIPVLVIFTKCRGRYAFLHIKRKQSNITCSTLH